VLFEEGGRLGHPCRRQARRAEADHQRAFVAELAGLTEGVGVATPGCVAVGRPEAEAERARGQLPLGLGRREQQHPADTPHPAGQVEGEAEQGLGGGGVGGEPGHAVPRVPRHDDEGRSHAGRT
jgi:hypothetical protein